MILLPIKKSLRKTARQKTAHPAPKKLLPQWKAAWQKVVRRAGVRLNYPKTNLTKAGRNDEKMADWFIDCSLRNADYGVQKRQRQQW